MTNRQLKPRTMIEPRQSKVSDRPLVIIGRQSTTRQIEEHQESLGLQIEDTRRRFLEQGWSEGIITVRVAGDGKRGVSGTLRIDQREELQETIADIMNGTCKAVGAYSISRLFRDKYGRQSGTFAEICARYDCLLILPHRVFNFRNPDDLLMFNLEVMIAARENDARARLMREAKHRKSLRGQYDGRYICPGYLIDRDKQSPTYDHYIPYEPHAEVSRRLYARFRELGAFNLIAAEVAKLPWIFPEFEEWVDERDRQRFQFKRVSGGYHISRTSLFHLLTAIEHQGYWHVKGNILTDTDGKPLKTHQAIVPEEDWRYAFDNLSFVTLEGLPNKRRTLGRSWTPVTKQESPGVLRGLLTSPLGTVSSSGDGYRVSEHREGHSQRSDTLVVSITLLDDIFRERLERRMQEMDGNRFFYYHVRTLKQKQKTALVGVKEQIENFHQRRKNILAFIQANGEKTEQTTLQELNEELADIAANLFDLQDKQTDAQEAMDSLQRLRDRLRRIKSVLGTEGQTEDSRRFYKLCTDAIILDEYSGRFLTLTVKWAQPFQRMDICYIYRPVAARQEWSPEDETALRLSYADADRLEILRQFPTRSWYSVRERAKKLELVRQYDRNESGLTDMTLSFNDWHVLKEHGWSPPSEGHGVYWLYDVVDDTVDTRSRTDFYSIVNSWLIELNSILRDVA